jgi:1-aminocyclopropane-1-carboxylate deaminase
MLNGVIDKSSPTDKIIGSFQLRILSSVAIKHPQYPNDWQLPSAIQCLPSPDWASRVSLSIKRDDTIHPFISGNKARKLYSLIQRWQVSPPQQVVTMGGNRSNYLHALGYLCYQKSIPLLALVRGHEPEHYHSTLSDLKRWQVKLTFVDKLTFRQCRENFENARSLVYEKGLLSEAESSIEWLPEGGSNVEALNGIMLAVDELTQIPDVIFVPAGTGCTALGIAVAIDKKGWHTQVIAVVVLKGAESISQSLGKLAKQANTPWPKSLTLEHRFCDKGFAKITPEIKKQKAYYEQLWSLPLEPVYSVKMLNAVKAYSDSGMLDNKQILLWHTGGLQGDT